MAQNTYSVAMHFNVGGQFATNVYHWQFDDAGYTTTAQAAAALLTAWATRDRAKFQLMVPTATTFLNWESRKVSGVGGFHSILVTPGGTTGGRAGALQVAAVSPCIIHYEVLNGPMRGRTFLPGVTNTDCLDGQLTPALKTVIETQMGLVFDDLVLAGGGAPTAQFGIWSRKVPASFHRATVSMLSDLVATQRRRQQPA